MSVRQLAHSVAGAVDASVAPPSSRQAALRQTVVNSVARWRSTISRPAAGRASARERADEAPGTFGTLPRRRFLSAKLADAAPPPPMKLVAFRVNYRRAFGRFAALLTELLRLAVVVLMDQLRGRNTLSRRAVHVRRTYERMGGTFVAIGQRVAMRLDLLRSAYGEELSRMQDRVPPFPVDQAVAIIERTTGKPLQETFAEFDPEPVVSTSTACTYQAVLRTGAKVVAKVRRPGVGELFLADLKVFDWIAFVVELLTILRPGHTGRIRRELRETLLEEIDFVREARHQDTFRRAARRSGKRFFAAPHVYFELSGEDVVVQEFVSGMWLWELVAAVEQNDTQVLALAARLNIDVRTVARRLLWVSFWSWHENLFFLAEPQGDNIILGVDGTLTFIDFSSTGAMDRTRRRALQQSLYYASRRDPLNMARASLALLEPLPPVDVIALTKDLEAFNWHMLYAFEAKGMPRPWVERTTTQQWSGLMQIARQYGMVVDFRVLRLLRAAIMHEALAVRLDESINVIKEYRRFTRGRAARAIDRARRRVARRRGTTFDKSVYLRVEQLAGTAESLFFRLRHLLTLPRANFTSMTSKGSYTFVTLVRFATQVFVLATLAAMVIVAGRYVAVHEIVPYRTAVGWVASSPGFQVVLVFLLFVNGRALLFRLDDKDV